MANLLAEITLVDDPWECEHESCGQATRYMLTIKAMSDGEDWERLLCPYHIADLLHAVADGRVRQVDA